MPAFVGPLLGFSLGVALAFLGRVAAELSDAHRRLQRTAVVALFAAMTFAPACAYFLVVAPDWSFAYLIDARAVPSAVLLLLAVLDGACVLLGFLAGRRCLERRLARALFGLGGAPVVVAGIAVLGLLRALRVDGTLLQVKGHFGTTPVAGGPLGFALLWIDALLGAGFVVTARALTERRRSARRGAEAEAGRWLGRAGGRRGGAARD